MNYIGEKIKELRRKNDMTQERLADCLGVAYQTVSKWETGVTSPDLSLIVPLARLFKVTTDELFCYSESADDLRKEELEEAYDETFESGDLHKRFEISEQAVSEFPSDMKWHERLAWVQAMLSFERTDEKEYVSEQEAAIKRFAAVIENTTDEKVKASAIQGIVQYLCIRDRRDEARKYAELYPENYSVSRDSVLHDCLTGEERTIHYQWMLYNAMHELLSLMGGTEDYVCDAAEQIIKVMLPDENYLYYHFQLANIYRFRSCNRIREGKYDAAIELLKKAFYHAREYDKAEESDMQNYTSPFFDRIGFGKNSISRSGTTTMIEDLLEALGSSAFDPVRDREDLKALLASMNTKHR